MKENVIAHFFRSTLLMLIFTLLMGIAYPTFMAAISRVFFPSKAQGQLIDRNGKVVGSLLIGQNFTSAKYFHPRPSANAYKADSSSGSYLGPSSRKLLEAVSALAVSYRSIESLPQTALIPMDAVSFSASGLDPHISVKNAKIQMARVAKARGITINKIEMLIDASSTKSIFQTDSYVNVLLLNLSLDEMAP